MITILHVLGWIAAVALATTIVVVVVALVVERKTKSPPTALRPKMTKQNCDLICLDVDCQDRVYEQPVIQIHR